MNSKRYLFLDDKFIEKKEKVTRQFHSWEKETGNPVIQKAQEWEGIGPYTFNLFSKQPPFSALYGTFGGKNADYPGGFIVSSDGINWDGMRMQHDGLDDNCQAISGFLDNGHLFEGYPYLGASIFRRTNDVDKLHMRFRRSKNGIHWEKFPDDPYWYGPSDVYSFLYDEEKKKYIIYYKLWKVEGETLEGKHFLAYFPSFLPTHGEHTFRVQGDAVLPECKTVDTILKTGGGYEDDGGGGTIDKEMTMIRVIGRAESEDFVHWLNPKIIIEPPKGAPLGDQSYGMTVQRYGDMYIGSYQHFSSVSGKIQTKLAWSYDSVNFSIDWDHFILPCSEDGWDAGMVFPTTFLEQFSNRMCQYYGAMNLDHKVSDIAKLDEQAGAIGRAWMRIDGFASLTGGIIETVPLKVTGTKLCINMKGIIDLTIKGKAGNVISKTQLRGDHYKLVPDIDLTKCIGKKVIIEMDLSDGEIFSIII